VNPLIELLDTITTVMLGAESGGRVGRIGKASEIDPFIRRLVEMGTSGGIEVCGDDLLCHGETVLVYAVEPLITPEGKGLADVAVRQLEAHGAVVERAEQPQEHVLSVAGSIQERWLEARIVASRGWVFLIDAPSMRRAGFLAGLLDRAIAEIEEPSNL
jgi:hypothetical protein